MSFLAILLVAVALSVDSFSVSLAAGMCKHTCKLCRTVLFSLTLAIVQGGLFALGWWLGFEVVDFISSIDHWIAFVLLLFIGGRMIYDGFKGDDCKKMYNPFTFTNTLILSIGTSIDAMAVGLAFACSGIAVLLPTICITIATFIFSSLGLLLGRLLGKKVNFPIEIIGGLVLIAIGVKIFLEHLGVL